jgi:hypothetical protein
LVPVIAIFGTARVTPRGLPQHNQSDLRLALSIIESARRYNAGNTG